MVSPVRHLLLQSQGLFLSSGGVVKNSPEVFAMYSWMKNVSFYSIIYIRVFTFVKNGSIIHHSLFLFENQRYKHDTFYFHSFML